MAQVIPFAEPQDFIVMVCRDSLDIIDAMPASSDCQPTGRCDFDIFLVKHRTREGAMRTIEAKIH